MTPCVADLEEIGDLEGYIRRSVTILVYCSKGYFQSKNCMRELVSSTTMQKPMIALMEPDASRGGLNSEEIKTQLLEAEASYSKWDFPQTTPLGQALYSHLFTSNSIEWNRKRHGRRKISACASSLTAPIDCCLVSRHCRHRCVPGCEEAAGSKRLD